MRMPSSATKKPPPVTNSASTFSRRQALKGLVDAAAGGSLEHENLLPDSRCLNVA